MTAPPPAPQSSSPRKGFWGRRAAILAAIVSSPFLVFFGLVFWADQADKQPIKWPTPTRECLATGRARSDAEFLELAIERQERKVKDEQGAAKERDIDGPILRAESRVERINAVPDDGDDYKMEDLDIESGLEERYHYAQRGLKQYVRVYLAAKAPPEPIVKLNIPEHPSLDSQTARRPVIHIYDFDLCGASL